MQVKISYFSFLCLLIFLSTNVSLAGKEKEKPKTDFFTAFEEITNPIEAVNVIHPLASEKFYKVVMDRKEFKSWEEEELKRKNLEQRYVSTLSFLGLGRINIGPYKDYTLIHFYKVGIYVGDAGHDKKTQGMALYSSQKKEFVYLPKVGDLGDFFSLNVKDGITIAANIFSNIGAQYRTDNKFTSPVLVLPKESQNYLSKNGNLFKTINFGFRKSEGNKQAKSFDAIPEFGEIFYPEDWVLQKGLNCRFDYLKKKTEFCGASTSGLEGVAKVDEMPAPTAPRVFLPNGYTVYLELAELIPTRLYASGPNPGKPTLFYNSTSEPHCDEAGFGWSLDFQPPNSLEFERDLERVKAGKNGEELWFFKNHNHPLLKEYFERMISSGFGKENTAFDSMGEDGKKRTFTYELFIQEWPVLFRKDKLNRLIRYYNMEFISPNECAMAGAG